jgi:TolB-like protein/Flp pilus assembly protein TadD
MKKCPECGRDYNDDSMSFCLDDGSELLFGPARSEPGAVATGFPSDEPQTAIFHSTSAPGKTPTRAQILTTDQTAIWPRGEEAKPHAGSGGLSEKHGFSALRSKPMAALGLAVLFLVLVGGYFGYRYFSPPKQIESIAVMPFVNESGNSDVEYLTDGMTETLIGSLSNIPNLSVKARSSVFRYKGKEIDPRTIGRELNVQAVLIGRVILRGDQLTLLLEMIDPQTENVIWADKYERRKADLVSLQGEIARDVSSMLRAKLSGADIAKVQQNYTSDPEAYQLYLKGRFFWNKRTMESLKQATEYYRQAVEKDPNYARAYAGLAETYVLYPIYSVASPNESMPLAKATALRALAIDDSVAEAHAALGAYLGYFEFDRTGAEQEYRRAIELNPNYATAHHWLANHVLGPMKRFDEALIELRLAEDLDPLSPIIGTNLGDSFIYTRQYDEAISQYKRVLTLDPNFAFARFTLGWAYYLKGIYGEANEQFRKSLELSYDPSTKGYLGMSLARSGQLDEARKLLDELKDESSKRYVMSNSIALIHIGLNEKDQALEWLEKDVAERSSYATFLGIDPLYDDLRGDPRFKDLLKRLNLTE